MPKAPDPIFDYRLEYYDQENILHSVLIELEGSDGEVEIQGTVALSYPSVTEVLETIRGSGLTLSLEADVSSTFKDLYLANERSTLVTYKRDEIELFKGYINPDNWYEDFVSDRWITTVECTDSLGFLEDLAFVDSNGLPFVGRMRQSEVIAEALKRTGIFDGRYYASINVFYDGLAEDQPTLLNVYVNADRYVKDDGNTIMSCAEVIKDILEPYGAVLMRFEKDFTIVRPNDIASEDNPNTCFYSSNGTSAYCGLFTRFNDIPQAIGQYQGSGDALHYTNENQSISLDRAVSAFRINYKYGLLESLTPNPNLVTLDGSTYEGWTIDNVGNVTVPAAGGYGVKFDGLISLGDSYLLTSDALPFIQDENFNFRITFDITYENEISQLFGFFKYQILLIDGGTTYYLNTNRQWVGTQQNLTVALNGQSQVNEFINADPLLVDGDIQIRIMRPQQEEPIKSDNTNFEINLTSVNIVNARSTDDLIIVGEFHTLERSNPPSSRVLEGKEVYTGDLPSAAYMGTTFQADGDTPTENWHRKGVDESKPLLRIMGEETLRINAQVSRLFSGDVYGYLPYLSNVTLEGVGDNFVPIEYTYDTANNITRVKLKEIFSDELTDITYSKTDDYGNTVKPTIVG